MARRPDADMLLELVPNDGTAIGNIALLNRLDWKEENIGVSEMNCSTPGKSNVAEAKVEVFGESPKTATLHPRNSHGAFPKLSSMRLFSRFFRTNG